MKLMNKKDKKQTISHRNYYDLALLVNTHAQAKSQLHNMKQAAESISRYVKTNKTEFMYYKQEWKAFEISRPIHTPGSNISSTESDINICIAKSWTAIDRLSIIWKSLEVPVVLWLSS